MRIIALISWYAESPTWLKNTVESCSLFCDHVVAVDGAFKFFPDGGPSSGAEQQQAIVETCDNLHMGCTMHVPKTTWEGNEIEKTTFRFRLGDAVAEPNVDWFFIIDADSVVVDAPPTVRQDLEQTSLDVATIALAEWIDWHKTPELESLGRQAYLAGRSLSPLRCFFRAIPGIWCEGTHAHWFVYRNGTKLALRGSDDQALEPALDLGGPNGVIVEHRNNLRVQERRWRAQEFYRRREAFGLEPGFPTGPPKLGEREGSMEVKA